MQKKKQILADMLYKLISTSVDKEPQKKSDVNADVERAILQPLLTE